MAIAFDNFSPDTSATGGASTLTTGSWAIAGTSRLLLGAMAAGAGTPSNHTNMKWQGSGGTLLTQIGTTLSIGSFGRLSAWRLIAPTVTSNTLFAQYAAVQDEVCIGGTSYTGVDQTTPVGTSVTNTGLITGVPSGNATVVVSSAIGALIWAAFWTIDGNATSPLMTPNGSPSPTGRYEVEGSAIANTEAMQIQEVIATGSSTTVSCQIASTGGGNIAADWGVIAFVINAEAGSAGPTFLMGQILT